MFGFYKPAITTALTGHFITYNLLVVGWTLFFSSFLKKILCRFKKETLLKDLSSYSHHNIFPVLTVGLILSGLFVLSTCMNKLSYCRMTDRLVLYQYSFSFLKTSRMFFFRLIFKLLSVNTSSKM